MVSPPFLLPGCHPAATGVAGHSESEKNGETCSAGGEHVAEWPAEGAGSSAFSVGARNGHCLPGIGSCEQAQMKISSSIAGLVLLGLALGGFVGFLLRPSAMLVGQLPFETVVSRGANLQGLDKILVPTAQMSFNVMVVGAIIGAVAGAALGRLITGGDRTHTSYRRAP